MLNDESRHSPELSPQDEASLVARQRRNKHLMGVILTVVVVLLVVFAFFYGHIVGYVDFQETYRRGH